MRCACSRTVMAAEPSVKAGIKGEARLRGNLINDPVGSGTGGEGGKRILGDACLAVKQRSVYQNVTQIYGKYFRKVQSHAADNALCFLILDY